MSTSSLPSFIKIHQAVLEKKLKMWKFTDSSGELENYGTMWKVLLQVMHI